MQSVKSDTFDVFMEKSTILEIRDYDCPEGNLWFANMTGQPLEIEVEESTDEGESWTSAYEQFELGPKGSKSAAFMLGEAALLSD